MLPILIKSFLMYYATVSLHRQSSAGPSYPIHRRCAAWLHQHW